MLKIKLLPYLASATILLTGASGITFSDSFDIMFDPEITDIREYMNSDAYDNDVMGVGPWEVFINSGSIVDFTIAHRMSFEGHGILTSVRVYGTASASVTLTANPGNQNREQIFTLNSETQAGEYLFDMAAYDMEQGGDTSISGFSEVTKITFTGEYMTIPEPAFTSLVLLVPAAGLALRRKYLRKKSIG